MQTALNPRLAISNQALLAALVSGSGALANFSQLVSTSSVLPSSSVTGGITTSAGETTGNTNSAATANGDGHSGMFVSHDKGSSSGKKSRHGVKTKSKFQRATAKSLHFPCTVEGDDEDQDEENGSDRISGQNGGSQSTSSPGVSHDGSEDEHQNDGEPPPKKDKKARETALSEENDDADV